MLSKEEVRKIAKLVRIKLSSADEEKFSKQLSDILDFVEILQELDTDQVPPMNNVTGLENITRPDEIKTEKLASKDQLLACSTLPKVEKMLRVKKVF